MGGELGESVVHWISPKTNVIPTVFDQYVFHQENPESASMHLEALGKRKITQNPTVPLEATRSASIVDSPCEVPGVMSCQPYVRADLSGHLKYSQRWSGVRAGVLLGAQDAVRRGENRGRL